MTSNLQPTPVLRSFAMRALVMAATLFATRWVFGTEMKSVAPPPVPEASAAAATLDLATGTGAEQVQAQWRYSDTRIIEVDFRASGADKQPTGAPVKTYDYEPHAGSADFDDSKWAAITPESLADRRGNGRISMAWYRVTVTVPEKVGDIDTKGSTLVFETAIDDYAEIWINGELARYLGQKGGSVVAGWNAKNRVAIGRNVKPGDKITLAIFGMNGPISSPPTNYIWMREAKLEFHKDSIVGPYAIPPSEVSFEVIRKDPALDAIVPPNPKVFKLAEGFQFAEGPIWVRDSGYLLFSDPNHNTIYKYVPDGALSVFKEPSGYSGADIAEYGQPGSNGLTLDPQGRLTIDQHGNRRVVRIEKDGSETVLADKFEGKRLNSPNDLVYRSDGALFFTDPPFGLPKFHADPRKELPFEGVFSLYKGKLAVVSKDFTGPNGLAFSPDEKYLYVCDWDEHKKVIMRYEVTRDAQLRNGTVFFDMTSAPGEDALDGLKVDKQGNLYVSGPSGLWILSAEGKHLGTIVLPQHAHNFNWGGADGKTLYLAARHGLYRMTLNIEGVRP